MSTATVLIKKGSWRNQPISNELFTLVYGPREGKHGTHITVEGMTRFGIDHARIKVKKMTDFVINDPNDTPNVPTMQTVDYVTTHSEPVVSDKPETDEEIMERVGERFDIMNTMVDSVLRGDTRALIITGPPGVGKTFTVQEKIDNAKEEAQIYSALGAKNLKFTVFKGVTTALGLYVTLYQHADEGSVIAFDDSDGLFADEASLALLKAALDSGKRRKLFWHADSNLLRREAIPDSFDFKGSVIFLTNLKFDEVRSKKLGAHLDAFQSRCHFLDLTMYTLRERFLRVKQVLLQDSFFERYEFNETQKQMVLDFMLENQNRLREMSIRMATKICDLMKMSPEKWQRLANVTCMKNS